METAFENVNKYAKADTEHAHQVALFMWAAQALAVVRKCEGRVLKYEERTNYALDRSILPPNGGARLVFDASAIEQMQWMFAIPNGGERVGPVAARMKAEGVKSGVCDVFLPVPMLVRSGTIAGYAPGLRHGLFIEMKRPQTAKQRAGTISDAQRKFIDAMRENGYVCVVCTTFVDALTKIWSYLH